MKRGIGRRGFLSGTFSSLGAVIAARVGWLFPEIGQSSTTPLTTIPLVAAQRKPTLEEVGGELYAGFVLLPDGAPLPDIVQDYKYGAPTMCGVSDDQERPVHHEQTNVDAVHIDLTGAEDLANQGRFPVYTLDIHALHKLAPGLRPSGASLIRHEIGALFGGWVTFEAYDQAVKTWYTPVSILAQVDFARPFPLWSSNPVEEGGPAIILEKVNFLPDGPGILIPTPVGFALHWIRQDILYTMSAEHLPGIEVKNLASALTLVA